MLAEDLSASKQDRTLSSDETRLLFKAIFFGFFFNHTCIYAGFTGSRKATK